MYYLYYTLNTLNNPIHYPIVKTECLLSLGQPQNLSKHVIFNANIFMVLYLYISIDIYKTKKQK